MRLVIVAILIAVAAPAFAQGGDPAGTWEWAWTREADGTLIEPPADGHTYQYHFAEDGTFVSYRDEQVTDVGTWSTGEVLVDLCFIYFLDTPLGLWTWELTPGDVPALHLAEAPATCPPTGPGVEMMLTARQAVPAENEAWGALKSMYR